MTRNPLNRAFIAIAAIMLLHGCATPPSVPGEAGDDAFILERDLAGRTVGDGEFRAINGTQRGFTAYLEGSWDGAALTLVEDFVYDDGERDRETWVLTKTQDGEWRGTREDVIGTARGYQDGNAFRLEYEVQLPGEDGGDGMTVKFRDVLVKRDDGVILNTATVGKWGFRVGRVALTIRPAGPGEAAAPN